MDDPWQGKWLKASVQEKCGNETCRYTFAPLAQSENERAGKLPGVNYRRTLKCRLVFAGTAPAIASLHVFSDSQEQSQRFRIELSSAGTNPESLAGALTIYNGVISSIRPWHFEAGDTLSGPDSFQLSLAGKSKGFLVDIVSAMPSLPGSHDQTILTVRARDSKVTRNFSFDVRDLGNGPISIPDVHARVVSLDRGVPASVNTTKLRVRARIPAEPEQTYARAASEIPPLDMWQRESGQPAYLPVAADSSWQKFAVEVGGNVFISKRGIKAKGKELARLNWDGDQIYYKIGTGLQPDYRQDHKLTISKLEGCLPYVIQSWERDGIAYQEEAFAILLHGPLSPEDSNRSEETPAIMFLRLTAQNASSRPRSADIWLSMKSNESLAVDGKFIVAGGHVRAGFELPADAAIEPAQAGPHMLHIKFNVPAGGNRALVLKVNCVSELSAQEKAEVEKLDFTAERARVVLYWKQLVEDVPGFKVPEPKFNDLERAIVADIHISTTKDPRGGHYIVPASSYVYDEFENEACYQILLLDTLGEFKTATAYLETMLQYQGSKNFPGNHQGSIKGIFHGVRVSEDYDYTAHGYGLDHGTVLWVLAQHYLYTRDRAWLEHAWPHMKKAIEWIEQQRATTKLTDLGGERVREFGLLPAAQLEDNSDWAYWFANNAYAAAGMQRTAEALTDAGMPEAETTSRQAQAYRDDLRASVTRAIEAAPVARMQDGTYAPYVPVVPNRRLRFFGPAQAGYYDRYGKPGIRPLLRLGADRDTLCGAVMLLLLGIFSPDEPIGNWILDDWEDNLTLSSGMGMNIHGITDDKYWFSQGGMVFQANLVNPIPVYLHNHESEAAIRLLYNDFLSCVFPALNAFTEEYHEWRHGSGPFYKIPDQARFVNRVRDSLVFEDGDELWLASGAPRRWLESRQGIQVHQVQTFFGPVRYDMHAGHEAGTIEANVQLPQRAQLKKAWLVARTPTKRIFSVSLNGKPWTRIDAAREAIELPVSNEALTLVIRYR